VAAAWATPTSSLHADVVRTASGLTLEGATKRQADGSLTVETAGGRVALPAAEVLEVKPGDGPRTLWRREADRAPADAAAWYRLALSAEAQGLASEAREAHGHVVALAPDHAASRRALGQERVGGRWLTHDEARRASGFVLYAGTWHLPEELEVAQRSAAAPRVPSASRDDARLRSLLTISLEGEPALAQAAERSLASVATPDLVAAALGLLGQGSPTVRAGCCRLLGAWGDESALRALLFHGARDLDENVRREAVLAAASFGHDDVSAPFVRALGSENLRLVANAAQALGLLGDMRAAAYVVKRLSSHGSSTRNFVAFYNQISYVRDYDVEIAQASNIANPNIGMINEGVVLDVKVNDAHYTTTWVEPLLLDALSKIVGRPIASRAQAEAWYAAEAARLPDFEKAPAKRAPRRSEGKVLGAPLR
jgi:hypothetical protein